MKLRIITVFAALILTGCGTYQLAGGVTSPPGTTQQQLLATVAFCREQVAAADNSPTRNQADYMAGLTLVLIPVQLAADRVDDRRIFADCMMMGGYGVAAAQCKRT